MNLLTRASIGAAGILIGMGVWTLLAGPSRSEAGEPTAFSETQPEGEVASERKYSKSAYDVTPLSRERVEQLASKLDEETYRITQKAGTEPAFCGNLLDNKKEGIYTCVVCGLPLFSSEHKFTSGTGWPSFSTTFDREHVVGKRDGTLGMERIEICCARCDAHLGHVFDDGPEPTGLRFCLNSASLTFIEEGEELPPASSPVETETAYFAGGCFWGIEHYFEMGEGVIDAVSGYQQGDIESPTYKQVCSEDTGHAETVKVVFDPSVISFERLLEAFFVMHDPTQLNRQGPDFGTQYRSGVWYASEGQREATERYIAELASSGAYRGKIVTEVAPAKTFYAAEEYHQDYIATTGRACHVKNPW